MVKGAAEELVALKSLGVPISIWGAGLKSRGQANRAEMIEALAGKNTLVHFTGHGLAQLNPPGGTELFMGYGLPSVDIAALTRDPVHASLVVLASCQGAYAARFRQRKKLWNRSNMAEALLFAGAKAVVAASWAVKNVSSAKQMMDFYGVLKTKGPVSALTHAYRRQIQRLNIPHPRFWAAYAVYGGSGRQAR
jgi:CHAT domain-containing protein